MREAEEHHQSAAWVGAARGVDRLEAAGGAFWSLLSGVGANGSITETLATSTPQNTTQFTGTSTKEPPPWARPRSHFVPLLVGTIQANETKDPHFVLKQETVPASAPPNTSLVVLLVVTKSGATLPAQNWYFDKTSGLPDQVDFLLPAQIGPVEGFPGTVMFSNYKAVGGVRYPFETTTFLARDHSIQRFTLQAVSPSATLPSAGAAPTGGAQ